MAKVRVMVVEDDGIVAAHLEQALEQLGYEVAAVVATGEAAVEQAWELHPAAILMDIRLRGTMTGVEAAAQIRARLGTPVIYLTAYSDEILLRQARATEPYGYLTKPVREQELRATLEIALYKHQMDQTLQHLHQVLRAVRNINRLITREQDTRRLLDEACHILVQTRDYLLAWIGQAQEDGRRVLPVARAGEGIDYLESVTTWDESENGQEAIGAAIRTRQPVVCQEIATDPRCTPWREAAVARGYASLAAVPMLHGERLFGVLCVYAQRPQAFDEEEVGLLEEVAADLAFALQSTATEIERQQAREALQKAHSELERRVAERTAEISRVNAALLLEVTERKRAEAALQQAHDELEQRIAERTRELATLYDVTAVASESLNLQVTLERLLERVLEALRCPAGAIHLLDQGDEVLRLAVQRGIRPDLVAQLGTLPADNSLMSWMLEHSRPVVVPDSTNDPRAPQVASLSGFPVYGGAPMRARGQALGVLSIFGAADQQFSVEDVALLTSIADHVGVAVENAQLRQQAEQAAALQERERLARELHDSVTQSLFSLTLFTETARQLASSGDLQRIEQPLSEADTIAHQALKDMRLLLYELRPSALAEEGLVGALRRRLDTVEKRVGIEGRVLSDTFIELPASVEEGLYYIAQEALNNALKHGGATAVTVHIRTEDKHVILEVSDNGVGFDPDRVRDQGGMGLANMRARAARLGGTLTFFAQPGQGTRVQVKLTLAG
ncbi:MAG: GAF domain-containing protein [Chloroflexi bacterium]|nr:GAF domain-containing protein [Chloroflexota bacterium]